MATPYMTLVLPIPGTTVGPDWATQLVTALGLVDSHDHSTGKGNRVTPAGLNINADLSFGGSQATDLKTATFSDQTTSLSSSFKNCVYDAGGNLYWNNGSGTAIQLTSGSTINVGSVNGISGLAAPASASFSSPDFVFKSGTTTYGKIDVGDVKIFEASAGITNAVTIKSSAALAASYSLTLPTGLPGATSYLSISTAGVLANVSADAIGAAMTATGADAILADVSVVPATQANLAANARTRTVKTDGTNPGAGGVVFCTQATFTTSSTTFVDATGFSVTLTTTGRPVFIGLVSGTADSLSGIISEALTPTAKQPGCFIKILRDAVEVSRTRIRATHNALFSSPPGLTIETPSSSVNCLDAVAAGTYVFKIQLANSSGGTSSSIVTTKLVAYEI